MTTRRSQMTADAGGSTEPRMAGGVKSIRRDPRDPVRNMERTQKIPVGDDIKDKQVRARTMLATAATMQLEAYRLVAEATAMAREEREP